MYTIRHKLQELRLEGYLLELVLVLVFREMYIEDAPISYIHLKSYGAHSLPVSAVGYIFQGPISRSISISVLVY